MKPQSDRLLTVDEAAELLNTGVRFVRRLIAERRIRFVYVGRTPHIPEGAIAEYIAEHTVHPVSVRWHGGRAA